MQKVGIAMQGKCQVMNVVHQNLEVLLFGCRHLIVQKQFRIFIRVYLTMLIYFEIYFLEIRVGVRVSQYQSIARTRRSVRDAV